MKNFALLFLLLTTAAQADFIATPVSQSGTWTNVCTQPSGSNLHVDVDNLISATTANQGTPASLANAWPVELTDGTNGPVAVKPASTAAVATDKAVVVAISPNNSVAVTGTFFQSTQPVSAASLPLPTGASTSALQSNVQSAPGTSATTAITVQGSATGVAVPISNASLTSIASNTANIPPQGQALASASTPVVLPVTQITALTATNGTAGSPSSTVGTIQGVSGGTPVPVTGNLGMTFYTRSDTYTASGAGTTVDAHLAPVKYFTILVSPTGSVTSWSVNLECSIDNSHFTGVVVHTNLIPGANVNYASGTSAFPCLYFRSNATALTLGSGTNIVATILGM